MLGEEEDVRPAGEPGLEAFSPGQPGNCRRHHLLPPGEDTGTLQRLPGASGRERDSLRAGISETMTTTQEEGRWEDSAAGERGGDELGRGSGRRPPDVEVLNVDVLVWRRFSLAPEQESFLGRGLCKTHVDSEHGLR